MEAGIYAAAIIVFAFFYFVYNRKKGPKIYGADKIHRVYAEELYSDLNKKISRLGSTRKTVEEIEIEARRSSNGYKKASEYIITEIEKILGRKMAYQNRAAITIRQAEHYFDRPMFRAERGKIILEEYEKDHTRVGFNNISFYTRVVGEYAKNRCLVPAKSGQRYKEVYIKERCPAAYVGSFDRGMYIPLFISERIPPIWTNVYDMHPTPKGGAAFDSENPGRSNSYCEFPPGVTIEEMEKVFERARQDAIDREEGRKKFLDGAREILEQFREGK